MCSSVKLWVCLSRGGPIYSFLFRNPLRFLVVLEKLQQVENELDHLIKTCSEQLFSLTDDQQNAAYPSCRSGGLLWSCRVLQGPEIQFFLLK